MSGLSGINSSYIALTSPVWSGSGPFDGNAMASNQLTTWWQTLKENGIASDLTYSGGDVQPWATLANGKNTAFGCGFAQCDDASQSTSKYKWAFACIVNKLGKIDKHFSS